MRLRGGEQLIFAEDLSGAFLFLRGMRLKKMGLYLIFVVVVVVALHMSSLFAGLLVFVCVFLWPTFPKNFSPFLFSQVKDERLIYHLKKNPKQYLWPCKNLIWDWPTFCGFRF